MACKQSVDGHQALAGSEGASFGTSHSTQDHLAVVLERSSSIASTAGSSRVTVGSCQLGGNIHLLKTSSSGSKRSLEAFDQDDDTPTKRTKDVLEDDNNSQWKWDRSPKASHPSRFNDHAEAESTDRCMSVESEAMTGSDDSCYTDLCCGESDLFEEAQNNSEGLSVEESSFCLDASPSLPVSSRHGRPSEQPTLRDGQADLKDMIRNLLENEIELTPDAQYMDYHSYQCQPKLFIDPSMRMIAVSWLVEVAMEYGLHQETLFLATSLLDRFLSNSKAVPRSNLQLISVACMLIAAKHEEEVHPSVNDFTNIADNCFLPADLLKMESLVLDSLSFRINSPTAYTFLSLYKQGVPLSGQASALASYFTELTMLDYACLQYPPSILAAAAFQVAQLHNGANADTIQSPLYDLSGFTPSMVRNCMEELVDLHNRAYDARDIDNPFTAVKDKYRDYAWRCVSNIAPLQSIPDFVADH